MPEIRLDLKDRRILAELDFNARQPVSKLARKVRVSKEVALYRIRKLEDAGIIKQYYAIINSAKLGYYYCRLFVKFQNLDKGVEENIVNYCKENTKTAYLGILDGSWDLIIAYWAKGMIEFEGFVDDFIFNFGQYILERETSIGLHISQFQCRFLLNQEKTEEFKTGGKIKDSKIDGTDKRLLVLLTKNARFSLEELSKELGLTGKALNYRIKNLVKKKIIVGFRTWIDYKRFGYSNTKVFLYLQNLTETEQQRLVSCLRSIPSCIYITKPIGKADIEFEVLVKSREEFFSIIRDLREGFSKTIRSFDQFIIHEEPISRFVPLE